MEAIAVVTILIVLQTFWFAFQVGQARVRCRIDAPACTGAPELERAFRVHQNTLEQVVVLHRLRHFGHAPVDLLRGGVSQT